MDPGELPSPCPARVAAATIAIVKAGQYRSSANSKERVKLQPRERLKAAGKATRTYGTPHASLPPPPDLAETPLDDEDADAMRLSLFGGTSFEAASWLLESGASKTAPCVLDFASDSEPGGGWKGKQRGTQEEGCCRSSNLGVCLEEHFENVGAAAFMPGFAVVYCPDVVVFRTCRTQRLLEQPFWLGVAAAALRSTGSDADIRAKVDGVLRVAGHHGHRTVVLGAWGCGAFGNDPSTIAGHMLAAVRACRAWFDHVVFAVLPGGENHEAFHSILQGCCDIVEASRHSRSAAASVPTAPAAVRLTEQHKWELLTALPECMQELVTQPAAPQPEACRSEEGARSAAASLLRDLKAACIAELAKGNSPDLVTRMQQLLPPLASEVVAGASSMAHRDHDGESAETPVEASVRFAYQEASRELVMAFIKKQRHASRV